MPRLAGAAAQQLPEPIQQFSDQYCKKTGQRAPENVGEIVRCILDSLALKYRNTVESIAGFMPEKPSAIHVVGGGCQDKLLCKLTSDASGLPVYAGPVEATAIGNISMQAIAAGELSGMSEARELISRSIEMDVYEPTSADKDAWDEAYERFLKLC